MPAQIVLLRGINLVPDNRLAMADLRARSRPTGLSEVSDLRAARQHRAVQ